MLSRFYARETETLVKKRFLINQFFEIMHRLVNTKRNVHIAVMRSTNKKSHKTFLIKELNTDSVISLFQYHISVDFLAVN